VLAPSLDS